jgi:hypothetical protein
LEDKKTIIKLKKLNEELINSENAQVIDRISIFIGTDSNNWTKGDVLSSQDRDNLIKEDLKKLDPLFSIRRAVMLHGLIKRNMPDIYDKREKELDIEDGVLNALLYVPKYKYGTRSIEAIIKMSIPGDRKARSFTKSMIPPPEQIEIHVDAAEFYRLMESDDKESEREL